MSCVYIKTNIYILVCACLRACMFVSMYICIRTCICICICTCICMCMCTMCHVSCVIRLYMIYIHAYIHTHTYAYIRIHTHAHMYTSNYACACDQICRVKGKLGHHVVILQNVCSVLVQLMQLCMFDATLHVHAHVCAASNNRTYMCT
jgi:hypothetical protein